MKKLKTQKGITLIALIITIVVLLILAVVAIGAAQESNIVGYAQNATSKYTEEKDKEVNMLASYESLIESINVPWSKLTVPVQYDKKYSNQGTGGTQILEVTLYSSGGANLFGREINKENVAEAVKEGYLKINSNTIEYNGYKFEFSANGKQIMLYQNGTNLGILIVVESEPQTSKWTTYGETQSNYFLVGENKAYIVSNGIINNLILDVEDITVKQYYEGTMLSEYTITDSRLNDSYRVLTGEYDDAGLSRRIYFVISEDKNNLYVLQHGGGTFSISLTYNLNNSIDYSSILSQIQ